MQEQSGTAEVVRGSGAGERLASRDLGRRLGRVRDPRGRLTGRNDGVRLAIN